jgi:hypothetical protein
LSWCETIIFSEMPFNAVGLNGSGRTVCEPVRAEGEGMEGTPGCGIAAEAVDGGIEDDVGGALLASAGWAQPASVAPLAARATRASRRVRIFGSWSRIHGPPYFGVLRAAIYHK